MFIIKGLYLADQHVVASFLTETQYSVQMPVTQELFSIPLTKVRWE